MNLNRGLLLRIAAALAILISGIVHLDLYFNQDYRFASPDVNFGRSILLNAISSGVIAIALVARKDWFSKVIGIGFNVITIAIFAYTHSEHTFLGYSHGGPVFEPSPQAQIALIVQIAAILLLAASFVPAIESEETPTSPLPAIGVAFAVSAIALIGLTLKWKPDDSQTVSAPPSTEAPADGATTTTLAGGDPTATTVAPTTDTTPGATSTTAAAGGAAPAAGAQAISIASFKFDAPDLSVAKGTTVTWTNNDTAAHSVVADDKSFVSENIDKGGTYQYTFETPGTFSYICGIHTYMTGSITVTG